MQVLPLSYVLMCCVLVHIDLTWAACFTWHHSNTRAHVKNCTDSKSSATNQVTETDWCYWLSPIGADRSPKTNLALKNILKDKLVGGCHSDLHSTKEYQIDFVERGCDRGGRTAANWCQKDILHLRKIVTSTSASANHRQSTTTTVFSVSNVTNETSTAGHRVSKRSLTDVDNDGHRLSVLLCCCNTPECNSFVPNISFAYTSKSSLTPTVTTSIAQTSTINHPQTNTSSAASAVFQPSVTLFVIVSVTAGVLFVLLIVLLILFLLTLRKHNKQKNAHTNKLVQNKDKSTRITTTPKSTHSSKTDRKWIKSSAPIPNGDPPSLSREPNSQNNSKSDKSFNEKTSKNSPQQESRRKSVSNRSQGTMHKEFSECESMEQASKSDVTDGTMEKTEENNSHGSKSYDMYD